MKIGGPKQPKISQPDPIKTEGPAKSDKASFEKVLGTETARTDAVAQQPMRGMVEEIATALRRGEIDKTQAIERLVAEVAEHHTRALAPDLRDRLAQMLAKVIEEDPMLAQKLELVSKTRTD